MSRSNKSSIVCKNLVADSLVANLSSSALRTVVFVSGTFTPDTSHGAFDYEMFLTNRASLSTINLPDDSVVGSRIVINIDTADHTTDPVIQLGATGVANLTHTVNNTPTVVALSAAGQKLTVGGAASAAGTQIKAVCIHPAAWRIEAVTPGAGVTYAWS